MSHKIALVGAAPSSDKLAPFQDGTWEIWACSPSNHLAPRVEAFFELHSLDRKWVPGNEQYIGKLQSHPRVYIAVPDARLPNGIVYPKKEVFQYFGGFPFLDSFFQSSVSYMLAYAIMQRPKQIGLWGIDMAADDEYAYQRPGCHFFFIEAARRGIEIIAPPQSDILEPLPLYGYKEQDPSYWRQKARKQELTQRINQLQGELEAKTHELWIKTGALSDIKYTQNTWRMSHEYGRGGVE